MRHVFCLLSLLASLAPSLAEAHNTSRAKSRFDVAADGKVSIEVHLTEEDLLDLTDLDLSSPREAEEAKRGLLAGRLSTGVPRWLRLLGDDVECPVVFTTWESPRPGTVKILAEAGCKALPEVLTIHWGLSAVSALEVLSMTTVTAPGGIEHATVLSRRTPKAVLVVKNPSFMETFGKFFTSGTEHILVGWDHLAFLLALLLGCSRWRRLFLVATAFTLAHSVTLALGATGVLRVSSAVVEPLIAASIAVAAALALVRLTAGTLSFPGSGQKPSSAAVEVGLVIGFGLVHGLGFATLLRDALGQNHDTTTALLAFNLGVEAGQIASLAIAFPLLALVGRRTSLAPKVFALLLFGLVLLGSYVAVTRAL